jgi:hypothetical protein
VLEELALHSLDDSDPEVAANTATLLERFGSREAEPALRQRYESWCKRWVGHESELEFTLVEGTNDRFHQRELGRQLLRALATGRNWLTDKTKLQRLAEANKIHLIQEDLDRYLKSWDEQPLTIFFGLPSPNFDARVAQYHLDSMDGLKNKLSQFPSGTKFTISTSQNNSTADDQRVSEIRAFLAAHGFSVTAPKEDEGN